MTDVRQQRIGDFIGDILLIQAGGAGYPGYGTVRIHVGAMGQLPITFDTSNVSVDGNLSVGGRLIGLLDCLGNSNPLVNDGAASPGTDTNVSRRDHKHPVTPYSEIPGTPVLAPVATSGAYADLTGSPVLGTAAALDVGISAGNVVQLQTGGALPALNGAALTGIVSVPVGSAVVVSGNTVLDSSYANKLVVCTAALTLTLPAASGLPTNWAFYVKPLGGTVTIARAGSDTIDGATSINQPIPSWGNQVRAIGVLRASSSAFYSY